MRNEITTDCRSDADSAGDGRRLRKIAVAAEWWSVAGIAVVVAYAAYLAITPDALAAMLKQEVSGIVIDPSRNALIAAGLVSLIPALIFITALCSARSLFRLFGRGGRIFHPQAPFLLKRLGFLALAAALAGIVVRMSVGVLMTSANPPGQRQVILSLSSNDVSSLIIGLLFLAFCLVMREGIRLDEDSRSIL